MSSKRSLKVVENSTKCQCITDVCSTRTKCKVFFVFQNIEMAVTLLNHDLNDTGDI